METYAEALLTHGEVVVQGIDLAMKVHTYVLVEHNRDTRVRYIDGTNEYTITLVEVDASIAQ